MLLFLLNSRAFLAKKMLASIGETLGSSLNAHRSQPNVEDVRPVDGQPAVVDHGPPRAHRLPGGLGNGRRPVP